MRNAKNFDGICRHNPSPRSTSAARFFDFLLHKRMLINKSTFTSQCATCKEVLCVPSLYVHPLLKIFYSMCVTGLESVCIWCVKNSDYPVGAMLLGQIIVVIILCMVVRVLHSLVFTFGTWIVEDNLNERTLRRKNASFEHSLINLVAVYIGVRISFASLVGKDLCVDLFALSLVCVVSSVVYRKTVCTILGIIFWVGSGAVLLCTYLWKVINVSIFRQSVTAMVIYATLYIIADIHRYRVKLRNTRDGFSSINKRAVDGSAS